MQFLPLTKWICMDNQPVLFDLPESLPSTPPIHTATPRLKVAERSQVHFKVGSLDDLIPADHLVRLVWDYVNQLNMDNILGTIQSVEGNAGRPAIDPKILLALWLYGTLEGVISARVISDYCEEHIAYQWICGEVKVNHHTISDFATKYDRQFDEFLVQSVTILLRQGLIDLEEVAQDGMRVRANAGSASFRRMEKLKVCHAKAKNYLDGLKRELKSNPSAQRSKQESAKIKAADEREKKVRQAIEELKRMNDEKQKTNHKSSKKLEEIIEKARSSTTDPESRKMKMACGGYRPAYNVQFATTKKGRVIVGVDVHNHANDSGSITPMIEIVQKQFGIVPSRWLVDAGYIDHKDITKTSELYNGCDLYIAMKPPGKLNRDHYKTLPGDSLAVRSWRNRMKTEEAKEIYKGRGSVAEFSNAQSRNKGLQQFLVRGLSRVKSAVYRFALAHNMQRYFSMRMATA